MVTLERLFKFFDQNYTEFSSFEKWKKQIMRGQLTWSSVHTEKFWQTSFIYFGEADNLECIKKLVKIVAEPRLTNESEAHEQDVRKAVALYDLGEFSRFYPLGRSFLEQQGAKEPIALIMGN